MNEHLDGFSDFYRTELITSGGMYDYWMTILKSEITNMKFYLETIEEYINTEKETEINQLEKDACKIAEDQRSLFWAWNYPCHWDDIFASNLRSSFLISLTSFLELQLNQICKDIAIIARSAIKHSDLKGSIVERSKKFLDAFGGFSLSFDDDWTLMTYIFDVRNVFVHNDGMITGYTNSNRLKKFVNEHPALLEDNVYIRLKRDFCFYCLDAIDMFISKLRSEIKRLCESQQ